jgi:hypothetical protein
MQINSKEYGMEAFKSVKMQETAALTHSTTTTKFRSLSNLGN